MQCGRSLLAAQVYALKQEQMAALVDLVLEGDRVIHEQQLGWSWQRPDTHAIFQPSKKHRGHNPAQQSFRVDTLSPNLKQSELSMWMQQSRCAT